MSNKDAEFKQYFKCPVCGETMVWDGLVRTSIPPKYMHQCPKCNHIEYLMTYDPEANLNKEPYDSLHNIFVTSNTDTSSAVNPTITLQLNDGDADPCASCPNNPKVNPNASGICHCVLPYVNKNRYNITF